VFICGQLNPDDDYHILKSSETKNMDSQELAKYLESTNSVAKPWLLVQLRLKKLEESREQISEDAYAEQLADIHEDLMKLGEWWRGLEDQVF
jgi:predicted house-cleaning noncanonical NTP pyrophosphatase (MazG superfamily)